MPWTGEDTKDVFKKVIGGLIAAAVLAMAYAIVESAEWYYSAALAVLLVVLVLLMISRFSRRTPAEGGTSVVDSGGHGQSGLPSPVEKPRSPSEEMTTSSSEEKASKKAAKAEQKRRKKEAKARMKGDKS